MNHVSGGDTFAFTFLEQVCGKLIFDNGQFATNEFQALKERKLFSHISTGKRF